LMRPAAWARASDPLKAAIPPSKAPDPHCRMARRDQLESTRLIKFIPFPIFWSANAGRWPGAERPPIKPGSSDWNLDRETARATRSARDRRELLQRASPARPIRSPDWSIRRFRSAAVVGPLEPMPRASAATHRTLASGALRAITRKPTSPGSGKESGPDNHQALA
jgi:hypothetical protein